MNRIQCTRPAPIVSCLLLSTLLIAAASSWGPREAAARARCDYAALDAACREGGEAGDVCADAGGLPIPCGEEGAEVAGSCIEAAEYYRKPYPPRPVPPARDLEFIPRAPRCEPCALGAASAVLACKAKCVERFSGLRFDVVQRKWLADGGGRSLADEILAVGKYAGATPLAACQKNCGPPHDEAPVPPFIPATLPIDYDRDHWTFVTFARNWNPNATLDRWLRSYTVNHDKITAPRRICRLLVGDYCRTVAAKRDQGRCDHKRHLEAVCDDFYRGKLLCPGTCYTVGGDGYENPDHLCSKDETCSGTAAVCEAK
jgi:hypothetical protein